MFKANKGFTLMETLVVFFISILILGALFTVSNVSSWSLQTGSSVADIQWQARKGMNRMLEELYVAGQSTVTINSDGSYITFQLPTIDATTGTIYKTDGTINWGDGTNNSDYKIRYLILNEQLIKRVLDTGNNPVSNTVLANYISNLSFTGYDENENIDYTQPNTLSIEISVSKDTIQGRTIQTALSSQVTFRN